MLAHPRQSPCNTTSFVCLLDHGKTRHWAASRSVHLTQVVTWSPNKKEPSSIAHLDKKKFLHFYDSDYYGGAYQFEKLCSNHKVVRSGLYKKYALLATDRKIRTGQCSLFIVISCTGCAHVVNKSRDFCPEEFVGW